MAKSIEKFLARADQAFKRRNYDYAVQMYLEALQVAPENIEARKNFRKVLIHATKEGSKIKPPAARTLVLSKDPKVQLAENEKAVAKDPRSLKYNMRVADALQKLELFEAAAAVYQFVIDHCDKGKDNVEAMKAGAQAYVQAKKPELATKLLSKALRLVPHDKELGDLQRNIAASSTLQSISSAQSSRHMLKDSQKTSELELLNKKVLSTDELKRAMGIINDRLKTTPLDKGMIKKKAEIFTKARQYDNAHKWLISRYDDLGQPSDIMELAVKYKMQYFSYLSKLCEKKAQEEPAKAAAYKKKLQEITSERKAFELQEYQRQVDEAPADLDKRYLLGKTLINAGRFQDAVEHLQKALKSPRAGKISGVLLGRCFIHMNRLELAAKQFQSLQESLNENDDDLQLETRYWLADVYEKQGNSKLAKELFQDLFMQNASFKDVGARLDKIQGRS